MISLSNPEVMVHLSSAGPGLWPFHLQDRFILAIKASPNFALAAKHKKKLKFHLYKLDVLGSSALGVITAIYDRDSAPLVIQTVCLNEVMKRTIVELASANTLEIYFFDFHNSELFGGVWSTQAPNGVEELLSQCTANVSRESALDFYTSLISTFSKPTNDGLVIEAVLTKSSMPDDIAVIHLTKEAVRGAANTGATKGIYQSTLTLQNNPGEFHEAEIARLLSKIYLPENVVLNPQVEGREFCDVLAIGKHEVIAVQAKTTVRTAQKLGERDERRNSRLDKHFRKAVKQARGAERAFYKLKKTLSLQGQPIEISPAKKLILHLIIIPEKHPDLLTSWSKEISDFAGEHTPVVVLDNSEFTNFVSRYVEREIFCTALLTISESFIKRRLLGEYTFGINRIVSFEGRT